MNACLNCNRSEQEIPLVTLQYQGEQAYICSQCFPTLIHSPAKLAGKIKDADNIQPTDQDH
jgi:hypothetical protein